MVFELNVSIWWSLYSLSFNINFNFKIKNFFLLLNSTDILNIFNVSVIADILNILMFLSLQLLYWLPYRYVPVHLRFCPVSVYELRSCCEIQSREAVRQIRRELWVIVPRILCRRERRMTSATRKTYTKHVSSVS